MGQCDHIITERGPGSLIVIVGNLKRIAIIPARGGSKRIPRKNIRNFHGKPMANGQRYNMYADTIAHRLLPLGTEVELENPLTGQRVKAVVTDRGPFVTGRDVDLSYGLARKLDLVRKGVGGLVMRVLG